MELISKLWDHYYYSTAIILFLIGFHTLLTNRNLIKKIIGMNIMDTAVFLFFISIGYIRGGHAPIVDPHNPAYSYIVPLPSALILTGLVVAVSVTAFSLSLVVKIYDCYGTVDVNEISEIRRIKE